jgi:hypothetical protein
MLDLQGPSAARESGIRAGAASEPTRSPMAIIVRMKLPNSINEKQFSADARAMR